jgi:hypothetical protein
MLLMYRFALRPDTFEKRIHVLGSHRGITNFYIYISTDAGRILFSLRKDNLHGFQTIFNFSNVGFVFFSQLNWMCDIQARVLQAHIFFYVPFRPNFDDIQAQVFNFFKNKIMETL